ncbi:MAG: hypothetical protein J5727_01285 [Kiritimatiellae bacterium]|nr:hypothetical protein [Kiritimatiellia bacterium]
MAVKNPFTRIVGPDGEWRDPDAGGSEFDPREEFMLRCLNAAANLRGVLTYGEFCDIYNGYASDHDAPVSKTLTEDELDGFMSFVFACEEGDGSELDKLLDVYGCSFARWRDCRTNENLVVKCSLLDTSDDERDANPPPTDEERDRLIDLRVAKARDLFKEMEHPPIDEEMFLAFEYLDDEDGEGGDDDGDDLGEPISIGELPPAKYTGPVDFKFVKDPVERDRMLWDYDGVRAVTREFVRHVVMHELTQEERRDAAKRLGITTDPKTGFILDANLDMVAGDFAAMMDDQHGEPAIKRILKRKDKLENEYDRAAAAYYENYRYTWLEVLAVKSGVGMKCRDLLTGEELFLMETSFSKGDVKGMTVCAGIAPMGSVYLVLGVIHPAHFENPATILKIVLTHLGLSTELPIKLSFADQARFAAETIRRINANDKFSNIIMG